MIRPRGYLTADPIETERGTHWRDEAACIGVEPELFFPVPSARRQAEAAKAVCNGDSAEGRPPCPVQAECLAYAFATRSEGVFGGMSERQRRKLPKSKRPTMEGA